MRKRPRACARMCSRAASCGPTISGATTRGTAVDEADCARRYPPAQYPIRDLRARPPDVSHPVRRGGVPQIASSATGGAAAAARRSAAPIARMPHARAIFDAPGRMMVLMTHNTDIGDSWEEEGVESAVLLRVLDEGLRVRDQRHRLRDDSLRQPAVVHNAFFSARNHTSKVRHATGPMRRSCFCVGVSASRSGSA